MTKTFKEKLKSYYKRLNKKPSEGTIRVYITNIRRAKRLFDGEPDVPMKGEWLKSEKLKHKVRGLPVNVRRHISSALLVATRVYNIDEKYWYTQMIKDATEYQTNRKKNKKSSYEKQHLPESFEKLKKKAVEFKRGLKINFDSPPTLGNLYKLQWVVILNLVQELPFRNDLPGVNVKEKKGNHLLKHKKRYKFKMVDFKNSDKIGPREILLGKKNSRLLKQFLAYRDRCDIKHDFLFSLKNGKPMTKSAFSQGLIGLTQKLLGKRVGTRLIRVLFATQNRAEIEKAAEVTNKLLHTSEQTKQYIRKD
jgi:hypothetical protein